MNFPKKAKKAIQVVDATTSLQESDEYHAGRTTIKRKEMAKLQTDQERAEEAAERIERADKYKMRKFGNEQLGELSKVEMVGLRDEINELTKGEMTKTQKRKLAVEKLEKIGAVVHKNRQSRGRLERQTKNILKEELKHYNRQKELGMDIGMSNPLQVHRATMREKYGEKHVANIKMHGVGHIGKDGSTLSIGKTAMRRTAEKIKKDRSGGTATNVMFKKFNK